MKHIYLNLKRFDVPVEYGGVNRLAPVADWGRTIVLKTQGALKAYDPAEVDFTMYLPEAHLLGAIAARDADSPVKIGAQGVYHQDVAPGGNFGAFTTLRPASAVKALGCDSVLIGHCEERKDKMYLFQYLAGMEQKQAAYVTNRLLNEEVIRAQERGLTVLYCIGETSEEQPEWERVLKLQLMTGLMGADMSKVVIAYEPVWSIGPGKTPADKDYITKIARYIKELTGGLDVVYGGGLKSANAEMLASIPEIDGGLIALTRFSGEIGFYPEEYLEIIRLYLGK
ncbi:MAG: triose-phosphate isomerase [Lachnospiraceae bacterium]|nr:triose-phosphate isomerase [Lachnospiraceae bacterium]